MVAPRHSRDDFDAILAEVPLFAQLSAAERGAVAGAATPVRLLAGEWLFRKGDPGDALYVVTRGRVEVVAETGSAAVVVRTLGRGGVLGELAMLTHAPRSASARARRDSELLAVRRDRFDALLHGAPDLAVALLGIVAEKLRTRTGVLDPPASAALHVLAVRAMHQNVLDDRLRLALVDAFSRFGTLALIGAGDGAADPAAVVERAERDHDVVLLWDDEPDADPRWTQFCARQADRVLVVADSAGATPDAACSEVLRGCDLALVGVAAPRARWLQRLSPRSHHTVRWGTLTTDVERLARRLLGRSLGVVLSGGGARALAHIGALESLVSAGIVLDRVGGCSMGALVGALHASGVDPSEMARVARRELVDGRPFRDYGVPRASLIRGRKISTMLERIFGAAAIEDLPLGYFAVSADLVTAELVVHRDGPLVRAVAASTSLPGLAPPIVSGRQLLVDGGVLDNLPIDVMAADDEGPVVAIDATGRTFGARTPGRLPALTDTVARAAVLGSSRWVELSRALAAVTISPSLPETGLLDFSQIDRAVAAGRDAAREHLDAIRGLI
jgi:predicted acylesterase/phospholipase RssA